MSSLIFGKLSYNFKYQLFHYFVRLLQGLQLYMHTYIYIYTFYLYWLCSISNGSFLILFNPSKYLLLFSWLFYFSSQYPLLYFQLSLLSIGHPGIESAIAIILFFFNFFPWVWTILFSHFPISSAFLVWLLKFMIKGFFFSYVSILV